MCGRGDAVAGRPGAVSGPAGAADGRPAVPRGEAAAGQQGSTETQVDRRAAVAARSGRLYAERQVPQLRALRRRRHSRADAERQQGVRDSQQTGGYVL